MKQRVLFVCLGNICRSPAAEEIFRQQVARAGLQEQFTIDSAGTYGGHAGELADPRMRTAAASRGYFLIHRSRQIRVEDFERFDRIVVMDDYNYEAVHRLAPSRDAGRKIYRMREFFGQTHYTYIPDPYYEGREGFFLVLDLLEEACARLLADMTTEGE